jgi:hypothetical protein
MFSQDAPPGAGLNTGGRTATIEDTNGIGSKNYVISLSSSRRYLFTLIKAKDDMDLPEAAEDEELSFETSYFR